MKKILAIGLDAAEYSLIKKWTDDGSLPNLKTLMQNCASGALESYARYVPGSIWYSFYLGQQPGSHGLYSYSSWRAEQMQAKTPSIKWLQMSPFWHLFKQKLDPRGIILNVPNAFHLAPFNGIELMSLASDHSLTPFQSYPANIAGQIDREFGHIHFPEEHYKLLTLKEFLAIRDELIALTNKMGNIYLKMMKDDGWNIFLAVFTATHRAGHRLWSTTNISDLKAPDEVAQASDALRQVYIACDQVIGKLMEVAGPDCIRLVFSFYGMHDNHSREVILPEMLYRILNHTNAGRNELKQSQSMLSRIRALIPLEIRHIFKGLLSPVMRQKLTIFWRLGQIDWRKTRAFVIPLEIRIGIRINLKGREAKGIVDPKDYDVLCQTIIQGLKTFVDVDTGKPLVQEIALARDIFKGERVGWLPDLLGSWNDEPASNHRLITSPIYGDIPWPTPGHNPEGRSGNHTKDGFILAHGQGISPGEIKGASIIDLAPTILAMLGQPIPENMEGRVLPIFDK